jgi:elongator complex protein 1
VVGFTSVDKHIYYGITRNGVLFGLDLLAGEVVKKVDLKKDILSLSSDAKVIGLQFVSELEALCIVSNTGDIVTFKIFSDECESVGVIQEGIRAMAWSPDQELVIFATGANTLLTMTKEFEILVENPIDSIPIKKVTSANPVSAAASEQKSNESDIDNSKVTIVWRADGQMYAVNSVDEADGKPWIRVWQRDGTLFSRSEPIQGLKQTLDYRPDGSIIASHQYLANQEKVNIVFFERNGLQHYDFSLEKGYADVKSLQWNISSDILMVHYRPSEKTHDVVQLWFRNNYHWYLKQELLFREDNNPTLITWDSEASMRLHIFTEDSSYCKYDFCWDHNSPRVLSKDNACIMAVIDAKEVRFTPFRYAIIPPPMSAANITCASNVNRVSFFDLNTMLVQLSDGSIEIYEIRTGTKPPKFGLPPKKLGSLKLDNYNNRIRNLRLLTLVSPDTFYGVEPSHARKADILVRVSFSREDFSVLHVEEIAYPEKIMQMIYHSKTDKLFVEADTGALFEQPLDDLPVEREESFLQPCQVIGACIMADEEVLVGLTDRGVLFIQSNIAASNCSSFALHDQFLLFTTYAHKLRLIPLHLGVQEAVDLSLSNPSSKYDESFRDIERGAKLVQIVPLDIKVILQMPRGNLEGIYPKAIILAHLSHLIGNRNYKEAVVICRKYILDMNLIYDHNPQQFLQHANEFVEKVANADYLNLFLSELRNEDVTKSKYPGYIKDTNVPSIDTAINQKINLVCRAIRETLENRSDKEKYLTTLITTFAKSDPPQLEEALECIRALRTEELKSGVSDNSSSEAALKYLIFLADVDLLYDVALGMYDFDLVLMVAQNSQKDPKEYLPFLSNLQKQETHIQRYNINMYLKRWEKALHSIVAAGAEHFETGLKLIRQQKLFKLGISLYMDDKDKLRRVYEAYGDMLAETNRYQEAAFAYMQSRSLQKAQYAFKEAGLYKFAFSLCKDLQQTESDIRHLAQDLVNVLQRQGKTQDAAFVVREYLKDDEEAILLLTKNMFWDDALRIAHIVNRTDLIITNIKPSITDAYTEKMEEMEENREKLGKYFKRLTQIREEKRRLREEQLAQLAHDDQFGEAFHRDMDAFSDTSSIQSGTSGYSGVSVASVTSATSHYSGRTQRNKKKRHKLRKGSPFEEENIVTRIESLVPEKTTQEDIGRLLEALVYFGYIKEAKKLQATLAEMIELCYQNQQLYEEPFELPLVENQTKPEIKSPKKLEVILGQVNWKIQLLE